MSEFNDQDELTMNKDKIETKILDNIQIKFKKFNSFYKSCCCCCCNYSSCCDNDQNNLLNFELKSLRRYQYENLDDSVVENKFKFNNFEFSNSQRNKSNLKSSNVQMLSESNTNYLNQKSHILRSQSVFGIDSDPSRRQTDTQTEVFHGSRFFCYTLFYIFYLVCSCYIFQYMETTTEAELNEMIATIRSEFVHKFPGVRDEDLEQFLAEIMAVVENGVSPLRDRYDEMNWAFDQSLLFATTTLLTIGYGGITPLTNSGKIFCIIFSIVGIPLTLIVLAALTERFMIVTNWLLNFLNSRIGHFYQPFNIRIIHLCLVSFNILIIFFIIPTFVFTLMEDNWTLLDAFYYAFISLTTTGLGDFVAGNGASLENRPFYRICIVIYLYLGVSAMMTALSIFYEIPQLNLTSLFTDDPGRMSNVEQQGPEKFSSEPKMRYSVSYNTPTTDESYRRVRMRSIVGADSPSPPIDVSQQQASSNSPSTPPPPPMTRLPIQYAQPSSSNSSKKIIDNKQKDLRP